MDEDFVPLVAADELPDDLRAQWEATQRPGMRDFIRLMAHAPDQFRRYNEVYGELRFGNHLGPRTTELVRLAVHRDTSRRVHAGGGLHRGSPADAHPSGGHELDRMLA